MKPRATTESTADATSRARQVKTATAWRRAHLEHWQQYQKTYNRRPEVRRRRRAYDLRIRYGLTLSDLERIWAAQGKRCPLCQSPLELEKACVDHVRNTHHVRGLLCSGCNIVLGYVEKLTQPDWLIRAEHYLLQ